MSQDLIRKILVTLGFIFAYRVLAYVPVPGVNIDVIKEFFDSNNSNDSSEPAEPAEPVRLIIINNDNDVKINNELTNYSSYLTYKEIEYFKIGELK